MYNAHCVAIAVAHPAAPIFHQFPPVPPCVDAVDVVAYEGLTATPAVHTFHAHHEAAHPFTHPREGQTVQVVNAVHPVTPDPAFPFLQILAVPVSVRVPMTYIAYHPGLSVTPVFTVRLL